ncbi:MAG: prepilin peptidase [Hyphomonas sp.]|uniref:prepilin peptidase n=1 Tax=Hyphomonas sp. TaxID=87 RepID=UPI001D3320D3|nr:A24 family peptidase [Hyphomonas sp.]MBA4228133.1 prepilin peptidase [Hyphomonas sp.]
MTGLEHFLLPAGLIAGVLGGAGLDALAVKYARKAAAPGEKVAGPRPVLAGIAGALVTVAGMPLLPESALLLCFTICFGWLLLALALIDLRSYLLPDGLNLAVFLLGGVMVALLRPEAWAWHLAGAAAGFGLLWLVEITYLRLRGIHGLGRGDTKLLGAIGMWTGLTGIPPVLLIASLAGILGVGLRAALKRQPLSRQTMIAFGPWIALGGYIVWLFPQLLPA